MAIQIFRRDPIRFSSNGKEQLQIDEIDVAQPPRVALAVIEGFDIQFANRTDHHLGRLRVFLDTQVAGPLMNRVIVTVKFGLRDWSDGSPGDDVDGDDPITGVLQYSVFIDA